MDSREDIIPISSRRVPRSPEPTAVASPARRGRRSGLAASAVGLTAVALIVGLAIGQWRGIDRLRALPSGTRAAAYGRAMKDIAVGCNPVPADSGPLLDHCRQQAQFVLIFPECAADCRRLVDPILPRARR